MRFLILGNLEKLCYFIDILNKLDVGDEVPEELYDAVAEVLSFVYSLAEEQKSRGR